MKYRNYIFDLYGTLITNHTDETDRNAWTTLSDFLKRENIVMTPAVLRKTYERYVREDLEEQKRIQNTLYPEFNALRVFERITRDEQTAYYAAVLFRTLTTEYCRPYPHAIDTLRKIREEGSRIYLLSNAQRVYTEPELRMTGILPYFDGILISSDFGYKKPDPRFMEELLRRYDLDRGECVMIGDQFAKDIRIAADTGMDAVLLNTRKYTKKQIRELTEQYRKNNTVRVIRNGDPAGLTEE